ncbi:uncharacterized protein LOC143288930 [Babylonia areolata]|uniref:uncharacterized protein LOC143288930 n=1 Tax=Babylonia areolata TaxID=304850 RepID=UPI003FD376F0
METGTGSGYGGFGRRRSRQTSLSMPEMIRLEGRDVRPARVEGSNNDVFRNPKFVLVKARWLSDAEVSSCVACSAKFNQLRRKHHCRQCGLVFCNKCCKEKVPLPQLACEEPERVCELCRPVAELVTKSRSTSLPFQLESAKGLAQATRDPSNIHKVVELGGVQALITLSLIDSVHIRRHVTSGLHVLSTHQQLHCMLAEAGVIKAVCKVLMGVGETEEDTLCDGISALMVFCKAQELKTKALEDGALGPVLSVCTQPSPAPALLALMTLSHIAESPATHDAIVDSPKQALPRILSMTASKDEQMQELSLKILAHLSNGNDQNRHRIVQEDFSSGRCLQKALSSNPRCEQVLCNAACLVANLATSPIDQGGLQEVMELTGSLLQSDPSSTEFLYHLTRALANFSAFKQNATRLVQYVSVVVATCLRSGIAQVRTHALRFLLSLLSHLPDQTAAILHRDGAQELLQGLGSVPGLMEAVRTTLISQAPDKAKPM